MLETILLLVVIVALLANTWKRPKNFPPGPVVFLLTALYPLIDRSDPLGSWTRLQERFGCLVGLVVGPYKVVLVSGWRFVKEALANEHCQGRPDVCLVRDRFDGYNYGVVFTEGSPWRVQRRFLLHHLRNLGFGRRSHGGVIEEEAKQLVANVAGANGKPIVLLDRVAVSVINTTWTLMGGSRFDHEKPIMKKLAANIEESLHDIQVIGSIAVLFPFLRYVFPGHTGYRSVKRGSKGVQEFTKSVIEEHKATLDPDRPRDFIDIYLLELRNEDNNLDPSFSETQLEGVCMDLLSAGTDTTSNSVTFAILYLALHPQVQELLHQEMDKVLPQGQLPCIDDRPNLIYTDATLMEVMRMRAPLPIMIPHRVTQDTQLGGHSIPEDTVLLVNVFSAHMESSYWGDPEVFRPERFITEEGKLKKEERLIPFGKGKRSCLGETIARPMSFVFFACLAYSFHFRLPECDIPPDTKGLYGFTLAPPPFRVIATPRFPEMSS